MMYHHSLRRGLFNVLMFLALLCCMPTVVHADIIDDLADLLIKIESSGVPIDFMPMKGQDIKESKELITCVGDATNDVDILTCMIDFEDSPVGKKLQEEAGIPSWFWDLMDTYIAFRIGDFWGLVARLGKAVICIIAQCYTGNDVCALIEDLINFAQGVLDAAVAVGQFFADFGGDAWEAAKDAGCALGLGGCDENNTPREVLAYQWFFAPKVLPQGLEAIKAIDAAAFGQLRSQIETQARANPPVTGNFATDDFIKKTGMSFTAEQVSSAASIYTKTVEAQWKADLFQNVMPALAQARGDYGRKENVAVLAGPAIAGCGLSGEKFKILVSEQCASDLNTKLGFAHVDRWVGANSLGSAGGNLKSNVIWCNSDFWSFAVRDEFANHLRILVNDRICPLEGQTLMCQSLANFDSCQNMMGAVGHEKECGVNPVTVGKDVAEKIAAELKAKGSKHTYVINTNTTPVDLVCARPTQQHACTLIYATKFNTLPQKAVNCALQMSPAYIQKKQDTAAEAAKLADHYQEPFIVDDIDPLFVHAPSGATIDTVKHDPQQHFVFDFPLNFPRTIDGLDNPALGIERDFRKPVAQIGKDQLKKEIQGFHEGAGIDPMDESNLNSISSPTDMVGGKGPLDSRTDIMTAKKGDQLTTTTSNQALTTAAGQSALVNPGQTGGVTQPMSGSLPPGSVPAAPASPASQLQPPTQQMQQTPGMGMASLADIVADPLVIIGGQRMAWGQTVSISSATAQSSAKGICFFPAQYGVRNAGTLATGTFASIWASSQTSAPREKSWAPLTPGATAKQSDILGLKPGTNILTLTLDHRDQVKETNEINNNLRLTVILNGECGVAKPQSQAKPQFQPQLPVRQPQLPVRTPMQKQ
jgi:hypothetical protein